MVLMGSKAALVCLIVSVSAWAQTPGDMELKRAQSDVEQLRQQVEAGVAPRIKLEQAEAALADAKDAELLGRTLYGKDLTEEQATAMEAAALRRLARRQERWKRRRSWSTPEPFRCMRSTGPKKKWSGRTRNMRWSSRARSW